MNSKWLIDANLRGLTRLTLRRRCAASSVSGKDAKFKASRVRTETELRAYFNGRLKSFSVPYDIAGLSAFTKAVLRETANIPYGQVRTYQWLAARLGNPKAARAVGSALARNPLPIIIPCHRVVRGDGRIGRFALGSEWKKRLLRLEKTFVKQKLRRAPQAD
jgi:methylated-DNA-[protein]-cysteine S-methyltransferase